MEGVLAQGFYFRRPRNPRVETSSSTIIRTLSPCVKWNIFGVFVRVFVISYSFAASNTRNTSWVVSHECRKAHPTPSGTSSGASLSFTGCRFLWRAVLLAVAVRKWCSLCKRPVGGCGLSTFTHFKFRGISTTDWSTAPSRGVRLRWEPAGGPNISRETQASLMNLFRRSPVCTSQPKFRPYRVKVVRLIFSVPIELLGIRVTGNPGPGDAWVSACGHKHCSPEGWQIAKEIHCERFVIGFSLPWASYLSNGFGLVRNKLLKASAPPSIRQYPPPPWHTSPK